MRLSVICGMSTTHPYDVLVVATRQRIQLKHPVCALYEAGSFGNGER